jgi:ABC-type glycerol-3-phosphate transport system substrate-binding protein
MKRTQLVILTLVCLALLSVGAVVHAQTEVTLSASSQDQLYLDYFNSRLPEWEALHPDITFTYDFVNDPNTGQTVLQQLTAGEEIPDLIGFERSQFPAFMRDGIIAQYFLDLSDLVADDIDNYSAGRMAIYSYEGKLYALESQLAASVHYYQPAIYEELGLEVPTTWEEALETGGILAENGSALTFATNDGDYFLMFYYQRGGLLFDQDANLVMGDETNRPLAIEVADFIKRGIDNGTFFVVLGGDVWAGVTIPTAYREGRLAGSVMPDWWATCCLEPNVEEMAGEWRVALPPVWEGGGHSTLTWGGTGWGVSSQSPDAEIAKEFIAFMYLGLESQVLKFQAINNFPWYIPAFEDPRVIGLEDPFFGGQKLGEFYAQVAADVPVWYQSPFGNIGKQTLADNLPLLFDGTLTPEQFVDNSVQTIQESIDFGF